MKLHKKTICLLLAAAVAGLANQAVAGENSASYGAASPFLAVYLLIKSALAAEHASAKSITILSPAKDAVLKSTAPNKLEFNLRPGVSGNHVQVYVDDRKLAVARNVSHCPCKISLPKLPPGKHTITLKEATSKALTGAQGSVTVAVI